MIVKIVIPGRLPGLNEYTLASRSNKFASNKMKKDAEIKIKWCIVQQCSSRFDKAVHISYLWVEENKKRDLSNIAFAKKFVEDALVEMKTLYNDGWKQVKGFSDAFSVDKENPRIEVTISDE